MVHATNVEERQDTYAIKKKGHFKYFSGGILVGQALSHLESCRDKDAMKDVDLLGKRGLKMSVSKTR